MIGCMQVEEYVTAALKNARYETLADGTVYGSVPALKGVWSTGETQAEAEAELAEVIEEWVYLSLSEHLPIPSIGGVSVKAPTLL